MDDPTSGALIEAPRPRPVAVAAGPRAGVDGHLDDRALVAGLRAGDDAAFLTLTRRHQGAMLRIARAYVADHAAAEDVVQETWLAVLRGIDRFDGRSSLKTWLYRILINRAKTAGQRDRRCVADPGPERTAPDGSERAVAADRSSDGRDPVGGRRWSQSPVPWQCTIEDSVVTSEAVGVVGEAINDLPPAQRLVVTLRDVECWTAQEVCSLLGLAETNQRVILHRARAKVRQRLESYFGSADEDERGGARHLVMPGVGGAGH